MQTPPRVVLHDHLDGALRPKSVVELARQVGHKLPVAEDEIEAWFDQGQSGSLESYLRAFEQTLAVMQTAPALRRVAAESLEDLAADGVIYAEVRMAPMLCTDGELTPDEVVIAITDGLRSAAAETGMTWGLIIDAMRNAEDSLDVAKLAIRHGDRGVVGFDLAGPEAGFPPDAHRAAIDLAAANGLHVTIHAGEAAGPESIERALACGAERIGHGVEIIDDCRVEGGEIVDLGPIAQDVHDRRVPLELCVYSNLHTKGWQPDEHPIGMLHRAGFNVTINTDNRLMSRTSMTREIDLLRNVQGFTDVDVAAITANAVEAAFCLPQEKKGLMAASTSFARIQSVESLERGLDPLDDLGSH